MQIDVGLIVNVTTLGFVVRLVWQAARLVAQFEDLSKRFDEHVEQDEKRFDGLTKQVRELQLEQARRK